MGNHLPRLPALLPACCLTHLFYHTRTILLNLTALQNGNFQGLWQNSWLENVRVAVPENLDGAKSGKAVIIFPVDFNV